ncbi:collagen alpha-2(I) chain-like isoform X2 [Nycticebus coucang]|uniref:collagen alpha-2(I) chain-like isoform X2 n=1 Tax=Nycticebus coucang TaxID=9470 RepID=UPI00234CD93B|nr:collagen alpha-2(I) chain-like isoform X2 [Nycticebus coucang]
MSKVCDLTHANVEKSREPPLGPDLSLLPAFWGEQGPENGSGGTFPSQPLPGRSGVGAGGGSCPQARRGSSRFGGSRTWLLPFVGRHRHSHGVTTLPRQLLGPGPGGSGQRCQTGRGRPGARAGLAAVGAAAPAGSSWPGTATFAAAAAGGAASRPFPPGRREAEAGGIPEHL